MDIIDPKLFEYATERQREVMSAIVREGSRRAAAHALGIHEDSPRRIVRRVKMAAAKAGYSPEHDLTHPVPDGFVLKGASTYYNKDGKPTGQWVKSSIDMERQAEIFRESIAAMCENITPLPPLDSPKMTDSELLTVIPMGDPHFGMLSWAQETGVNFDLDEAERLTYAAVDRLCALSPSSDTAMLLNLGDFFHADDSSNRTRASGNALDVDGRFAKIARVGVMAMQRCITRMLEKHKTVIVKNMRGNHDPHQSDMLTICLAARFHDNPRVVVDSSPSPFYYFRWGNTLIGSVHGDGPKLTDLPMIMADDCKEDWGKSVHRVWHCGHFHHHSAKDHIGCTVETHRTLAATDAWHHSSGYRSKRDMKAIVYDKTLGEVLRVRCGVESLR